MTVSNAADLRLPASMSQEEKARKVRMALETFGLAGREDTLVSKLLEAVPEPDAKDYK